MALDVKESHLLTAMLRIQAELPGDSPTKVLHSFIATLSTENPLTGSSMIKAISKTHSDEARKGLIGPPCPGQSTGHS